MFSAISLVLGTASLLAADESPSPCRCSPLQALVESSDLVVAATVESTWSVAQNVTLHRHPTDLKDVELLKPSRGFKHNGTLKVVINRQVKIPAAHLHWLKKDGRCILFLKRRSGTPEWETVEPYFSAQAYDRYMAEHISGMVKRAAERESK